jgi:hypothetical protein
LRTVIGSADAHNQSVYLHFNKPRPEEIKQGAKNLDLNKLMQNVGAESFDFGTFKAAYDVDPRVKAMIKNFDKRGIEPKTKNELDDGTGTSPAPGGDTVGSMAKRATDLGDLN